MADLKNSARALALTLRRVHFTEGITLAKLIAGEPVILLAILRHAATDYSPFVASKFTAAGVRLHGRTADERLADIVLRALRVVLGLRCRLTPSQFMTSSGFVEIKLRFVNDVLLRVISLHEEAERASVLASIRVVPHTAPPPPPIRLVHPRLPLTTRVPVVEGTHTASRAHAEQFARTRVAFMDEETAAATAVKVNRLIRMCAARTWHFLTVGSANYVYILWCLLNYVSQLCTRVCAGRSSSPFSRLISTRLGRFPSAVVVRRCSAGERRLCIHVRCH